MPRFAILRDLDPNMTQEDVDAGAIQSLFSLAAVNVAYEDRYDPDQGGIGWVRSYWQRGSNWGLCLYTAPDEDALEHFHRTCDVPYVSFSPVAELASPRRTDPDTGRTRLEPDDVLFAIETTVPEGAGPGPALFEDISSLLGDVAGELSSDAFTWVRSYWDEASGRVVALYAAPSREAIDALEAVLADASVPVRPITEIYPDDYQLD